MIVVNQEGGWSEYFFTNKVKTDIYNNYKLYIYIYIYIIYPSGIPIRTTLDNATTVQYAGLIHQLTSKSRTTVRDIDPQNDLQFLRIRTVKHEIMVAPGNKKEKKRLLNSISSYLFSYDVDKDYLLIVVQNPAQT